MRAIRGTWVIIATLLALTGCATGSAGVDQFNKFAQAGIAFADSIPPVLEESFETTVATDSLVLLEARPNLSQSERLEAINQSSESLKRRLAILQDLRQHANLLRAYFAALQGLAQSDAEASGLTDVANGLVGELGKLSPRIQSATIGDTAVSEFVAPAVEFTVIAWQAQALNREFERNAETIQRELSLQEAALAAVAESMRADLETQLAAQDRDRIVLPYARDGALPSDWSGRRLESLRRRLRLQSIDAAVKTARSLRASFVALVEGGLGDAAIGLLISDVSALVSHVERIEGR